MADVGFLFCAVKGCGSPAKFRYVDKGGAEIPCCKPHLDNYMNVELMHELRGRLKTETLNK